MKHEHEFTSFYLGLITKSPRLAMYLQAQEGIRKFWTTVYVWISVTVYTTS